MLVALARSADKHGRGAYPAVQKIMKRTRLSESSVRRALRSMKKSGVISHGDQSLVSHIRADDRPVVWDLDMTRVQKDDGEGSRGVTQPSRDQDHGVSGRHPVSDHEVSHRPERGVTLTGTGCHTDTQEEQGEDQRDNQAAATANKIPSGEGGETLPADVRELLRHLGKSERSKSWVRDATAALAVGGTPLEIAGHVMAPIQPSRDGSPIRSVEALRRERLRSWSGKPDRESSAELAASLIREFAPTPPVAPSVASAQAHADREARERVRAQEAEQAEREQEQRDDELDQRLREIAASHTHEDLCLVAGTSPKANFNYPHYLAMLKYGLIDHGWSEANGWDDGSAIANARKRRG